ncbi:MAG TPA: Holliday junction resolvase RuvX [Casimicrobiaceae bacterium]|nr:Holliday junction resolvase RuvX [Casimicrobiaceae bacterium]
MTVERSASAAPAGTVLAFDYGTQRIGVAVGETATAVAHPLVTLARRQANALFERIAALVSEWHPALLLVGLPTHADGTPHAMTARARRFGEELRRRFAVPVAFADERFTTRNALSALRESGASPRARADARDSVAAQIMLQAYLDDRHAA